MLKQIMPSIRAVIVFTIFTGLLYPLAMTLIAQKMFPAQAAGSLIRIEKTPEGRKVDLTNAGTTFYPPPFYNDAITTIGSKFIGQNFDAPQYFHPRPSAAGDKGYDAGNSQGSNLGPTNKKLIDGAKKNLEQVLKENPGVKASDVPVDAITASASGLDPQISPEYAMLQVPRVAKARTLDESAVAGLVKQYTEARQFGVLGEPAVNVLLLNLALDRTAVSKNRTTGR